MVIQGRKLTSDDIELIRSLLRENPSWNRTRLSKEICTRWRWRSPSGQMQDMACRSMLRKLQSAGHVCLPKPLHNGRNERRNSSFVAVDHDATPIEASLKNIRPLSVRMVAGPPDSKLFAHLLSKYHYLGYSGAVGKNLKYLVVDNAQRPLAALLFGSAAWKTLCRDEFIGWSAAVRKQNLQHTTNNMRFLILPWVRVPHLASHILGSVCRRIRADWLEKYNHPLALLETFVDRSRFAGTCYRAANWTCLGQTKGRTRNDRFHSITATIKDVYVYPLCKDFRRELCCVDA